eukprot:105079_1
MALFTIIIFTLLTLLFLPVLFWFILVAIIRIALPQVLSELQRILINFRNYVFHSIPVFGYVYDIFSEMNILSYLFEDSNRKAAHFWNDKLCDKAGFKYPSAEKLQTYVVQDPDRIIETFKYPLCHAIGIYPPWYSTVLGIRFTMRASTKELTSQDFGLKDEDWLDQYGGVDQRDSWLNLLFPARGRNPIYQPSYYLIKDTKRKEYVLTIRGSTTSTDWQTDAMCESVDFVIGKVKLGKSHQGMTACARWVYKQVIEKLRSLPDDYRLTVTGHSLGAGVASILGLLLLYTKGNERLAKRMLVYSFATPSVVSKNIAESELALKHIKSIILNTDVVSRIGAEQLKEYYRRIEVMRQYNVSCVDGEDKEMAKFFARRNCLKDCPYPDRCCFPVGEIYWFLPHDLQKGKGGYGWDKFKAMWDTARYQRKEWQLCDISANREIFGELLFDGFESVYAHQPYRYAWALGIPTWFKTGDLRQIQDANQ